MDSAPAPATAALDLASASPPPAAAISHPQFPISDRPRSPRREVKKSAIGDLNEPEGSSKLAIIRCIERTNGNENLQPTHSDQLALKSNGDFLLINQSSKLSGSAAQAPTAAANGGSARRKRGRPRKLKPNSEPLIEENGVVVEADTIPEKRIVRAAKVRFEGEEGGDEAVKKKGRGRPKKIRKARALGYPKRSPGRPSKSSSAADVLNCFIETEAIVGAKRRGRPKNSFSDGQAAKVLKAISRCPVKVGSRALGPAEPRWMVEYAQVRAKLDFIQSKMRKAIGIIKPHLMNQMMTNGQHLGSALQELDQISTMDVMAVSLANPDE